MAEAHLTAALLKSHLSYDPSTGIFARNGKPTGRKSTKGYVQVFVCGKRYSAHRLAWLYMYGEWPEGQLDHKNQVKDDNRIDNLRLADNTTQQENVALWSHNTSGFRGVSKSKNGRYRADIKIAGKTKHLGSFATIEEAASARMRAEQEHFRMLDNSPVYSRITHGEEVRVNNRAYSSQAPGTMISKPV